MYTKKIYTVLLIWFFAYAGKGQDSALGETADPGFQQAYDLAFEGRHASARQLLEGIVKEDPENIKARNLLASTYSWQGQYRLARQQFNVVTSRSRENADIWEAAIKNELYAKNNATALGLANKALFYLKRDTVAILRLRDIARQRLEQKAYTTEEGDGRGGDLSMGDQGADAANAEEERRPEMVAEAEKEPRNRLDFGNAVTVFDQRYDPMVYSSVSLKHQTKVGSLIPRINYSNRLGKNGLQYDLDLYPKFSKRFYAYLNYGYSNSSIYPKHKLGGDLYVNLPGAFEFSAGGRHILYDTNDVTVITNSLGHYRGNYYFSLRSYITPQPDKLTRFSGNLLVRKYLKDAENYFGINAGMGYSPELRQIISGEELLAETLLYVESQRLSLEYQFTGKNDRNSYRANIGATRQELAYAPGEFFYGISGGITYQVKF
ncbi:YaiO family outer membrane beta-barrel protein [Pseudozobellia thermophila]|uniref:Outer membrane protein, YaiO family n=1 Tax=Pseudozobellia thermophila TaxID=192903 RepID=A0A1M6ERW2_9FLAO|nr:YaiO family outer membrane beta-barrel protein [Pseudozobellia thermophila]SHI88252.1 outer membrane protein, YaiO family [Pseudozobellia thermophila]